MEALSPVVPNPNARFHMRLGVIGHVPHWFGPDGSPVAYEPYVREMRVWADLFSEIHICSPCGDGKVRGNVASYGRANIQWHPVPFTFAPGRLATLKRMACMPGVVLAAWRTVRKCDFIHLRSPGYFGLAGAAVVRLLGRRSLTKWAGENGPFEGEGWVTRADRLLQCRPSACHPVLVYGPAKEPHQIPFIPALMSEDELLEACELSSAKQWGPPWQIVSVGRLVPEKGFDLAIRGLALSKNTQPDLDWSFCLVGDGLDRPRLAALAAASGLGSRITFTGALSFREVQRRYAAAHLVIMPGVKEGWAKVIAEAWG